MNSHKILIVEDDKFIHSVIAMKLSAKGYKLLSAPNGLTALEMAAKESPDIILMDILLPEMSGFEILEKLKTNPATKDIPVLVFSNLSQQSDMDKAFKLGASNFFIKAQNTPDMIAMEIEKQIQLKATPEHSQS